ncbi:uncharacterized protein PWA37_003646 [Arxiozyma heterogenica]|uniref:Uncharacterized protein n=1 Tax=Arxiozyma heterogenica TaxID=278026 RepID=A0AAN7W576_9SACH|nr:hypothetical protein RI543_001039 [Kazachstania heterogenica]
MAFLQLATEVSQPFVINGVSPITPTCSRKNSLHESATVTATTTNVDPTTTTQSINANRQARQRHNSLSLL